MLSGVTLVGVDVSALSAAVSVAVRAFSCCDLSVATFDFLPPMEAQFDGFEVVGFACCDSAGAGAVAFVEDRVTRLLGSGADAGSAAWRRLGGMLRIDVMEWCCG
jgi:hypothetical protein